MTSRLIAGSLLVAALTSIGASMRADAQAIKPARPGKQETLSAEQKRRIIESSQRAFQLRKTERPQLLKQLQATEQRLAAAERHALAKENVAIRAQSFFAWRLEEFRSWLDAAWLRRVSRTPAHPSASPNAPDPNQRYALLLTSVHEKINTIKLVMDLTGVGLREARALIESQPPILVRDGFDLANAFREGRKFKRVAGIKVVPSRATP